MSRSNFLPRVLVRGAGDLATGILQCLWRAGFPLLATETAEPLAVRRSVALCEAVYDGSCQVEDIRARRIGALSSAASPLFTLSAAPSAVPRKASPPGESKMPAASLLSELEACWEAEILPLLIDPELRCLSVYRPAILVDATLRKKNSDLFPGLAPLVIALGPGFTAGKDCHLVIETMRGHQLGRLIFEGEALPNTHIPGIIGGVGRERVLRAPADGFIRLLAQIGDLVDAGQPVAEILQADGSAVPVCPEIRGLLRGLLRDGLSVRQGLKIGDVDPREDELDNIRTISDKARNLGGAVLSGIFALRERWQPSSFPDGETAAFPSGPRS